MSQFFSSPDSFYHYQQITEELRRRSVVRVRHAARRNRDTRERIEALEQEVGELTLVCTALLTMLEDSNLLDRKIFEQAMERIDAEDGAVDGQVTPAQNEQEPPIVPPLRSRKRRG